MMSIVLLVILVLGFLVGVRRGLILQLVHMTGFIIAFIIAFIYFDNLAPRLRLWIPYSTLDEESTIKFLFDTTGLDEVFYRAFAFVIIFFSVKILMQIIGSMLDFLSHLPILKQVNAWAGGILGFIEIYLIMLVFLYIVALLPLNFIQDAIQESALAKTMIQHTPIFSAIIKNLWFQYIG
ncbi:CvpA family protein [Bacillus sp. HMF5848]|uniref:CvpA family protein n=1 Tax=Bacillus sp. HMF5848 TaxID=2495421 RepID=UPI000F770D75|nr:CvpA family protein [Bacillus sp. HMF5848]RSK28092.1 CvpA family protein [Bacillus sp. HMF5848]